MSVLHTLSNLAYKAIKKNGEFVLPGFGKIVKQKRKARTGFNPKTQQKIKIPAKTVVFYKCTSCKMLLRPKSGDCCVFCSYGSVKCPPMQGENCTC